MCGLEIVERVVVMTFGFSLWVVGDEYKLRVVEVSKERAAVVF